MSRRGRSGGGGSVDPKGENNKTISGLGCEKALVGTGSAIFLLLCVSGLRKQSLPTKAPFLACIENSLISSVVGDMNVKGMATRVLVECGSLR